MDVAQGKLKGLHGKSRERVRKLGESLDLEALVRESVIKSRGGVLYTASGANLLDVPPISVHGDKCASSPTARCEKAACLVVWYACMGRQPNVCTKRNDKEVLKKAEKREAGGAKPPLTPLQPLSCLLLERVGSGEGFGVLVPETRVPQATSPRDGGDVMAKTFSSLRSSGVNSPGERSPERAVRFQCNPKVEAALAIGRTIMSNPSLGTRPPHPGAFPPECLATAR